MPPFIANRICKALRKAANELCISNKPSSRDPVIGSPDENTFVHVNHLPIDPLDGQDAHQAAAERMVHHTTIPTRRFSEPAPASQNKNEYLSGNENANHYSRLLSTTKTLCATQQTSLNHKRTSELLQIELERSLSLNRNLTAELAQLKADENLSKRELKTEVKELTASRDKLRAQRRALEERLREVNQYNMVLQRTELFIMGCIHYLEGQGWGPREVVGQ